MLIGFENEFVVKNMFGEIDVFSGAIIDNIIYYPLSGMMTMDIQIKSRAINPPRKWGEYDYISLNIEFFGIKEMHMEMVYEVLTIREYTINKQENYFIMKIVEDSNTSIRFKFSIARIQRVVPMKYKDELEKYESTLFN